MDKHALPKSSAVAPLKSCALRRHLAGVRRTTKDATSAGGPKLPERPKLILAIFEILAVLAIPMTAAAQTLPDGPGKAELLKVCGTCHQAERSAAVRLTREGWEGVISDMISRGAKATDAEFAAILDYLTKNFLGDAPRPLNINKANNVELESVAGLTRKEAAALLKWREQAGACKSLDDLKKVPGLDYKKIEARKDFLVCFEAVPAPPQKDK
jgi:competence protein ComEA